MIECTVAGDRAELFRALFGSDTVPIKSATAEIAYTPEGEFYEIYRLDPNGIKPEHRERAINYLSVRFNLSPEEIAADFDEHGMPIIAKDTLIGLPHSTIIDELVPDEEVVYWDSGWDWEQGIGNQIVGDL